MLPRKPRMYKLPSLHRRVHARTVRVYTHEHVYIVNRLSVRLTLVHAKRTPVQRTVTNDDADKETRDREPSISTWTYASRTHYRPRYSCILAAKTAILYYLWHTSFERKRNDETSNIYFEKRCCYISRPSHVSP